MNAKEDLYRFVGDLRNRNLPLIADKNIESYCKSRNIVLEFRDFDSNFFCGAAFVGRKHDTIVLNGKRNNRERIFDFMHELIHINKHRAEESKAFLCFDRKQNMFLEWEANEGAAEILVPYKTFIPRFSSLLDEYQKDTSDWQSKYDTYSVKDVLAREYGVSDMVIENRISNLSYEIDQYRNGINVDNISVMSKNQQQRYGIEPTGYVNILKKEEVRHIFTMPWDGILSAGY